MANLLQGLNIKDLFGGLEGIKERQKQSAMLTEGLETLRSGVEDWAMGMGPDVLDTVIGQTQAPIGAQGLPTKAGAGGTGKGGVPGKPATFPGLEKVLGPLEKLGGGVQRGVEALLSPVSGVLNVLQGPHIRALEKKLGTERGIAGMETGFDLQKMFGDWQKDLDVAGIKAKATEDAATTKAKATVNAAQIRANATERAAQIKDTGYKREDVAAAAEQYIDAETDDEKAIAKAVLEELDFPVDKLPKSKKGWGGIITDWIDRKLKSALGGGEEEVYEFDPNKGIQKR